MQNSNKRIYLIEKVVFNKLLFVSVLVRFPVIFWNNEKETVRKGLKAVKEVSVDP